MGFTQLLAASRSLRNIKDGPSRYRMSQAHLLPKFGADKSAEKGQPPAADGGTGMSEPVAALAPTIPVADTPRELEPAKPPITKAVLAEAAKRLRPFAGWSLFRNPFGGLARKTVVAPVQTELSLDAVRPVRSRLGDEDFEPVRTPRAALRATVTATKAAPVRPAVNAIESRWRQWKARWFGASGQP